jgi:hypothetical protein
MTLNIPVWLIVTIFAISASYAYVWWFLRVTTTPLRGPTRYVPREPICSSETILSLTNILIRDSFWFGQMRTLYSSPNPFALLDQWASQYGSVFYRPGPLGGGDLLVADPKALAHLFAHSDVKHPSLLSTSSFFLIPSSGHLSH